MRFRNTHTFIIINKQKTLEVVSDATHIPINNLIFKASRNYMASKSSEFEDNEFEDDFDDDLDNSEDDD